MSFGGANINKLNGGILHSAGSDRVIVLIAGMTLPAGMAVNTKYELLDLPTAEDLGITKTHDDTNSELTHYNLEVMFGIAPESKFFIIPVAKTSTITALVANDDFKAAIRSVEGVNCLGIVGLNTTAAAAATDAVALQGLVDEFASEHLLIDGIIVEGVGAATPVAITDYEDLRSLAAPNISYFIGQDPLVAALKPEYAIRASVGTVLGCAAVRKVHEDLGSVNTEEKPRNRRGTENFSLTIENYGYWKSAALSDGTTFNSLSIPEQKSLTAKGWMYVGAFANYPGFYMNGCPTAVSMDSDYAYFWRNSVWNKAARIIRNTLIPRVRSKVPKETDGSGNIKSTWISGCEGSVVNALEGMKSAGNIDAMDIYINPAQSPSETVPLRVKAMLQVGDIVHEFDVDLGLTNKL